MFQSNNVFFFVLGVTSLVILLHQKKKTKAIKLLSSVITSSQVSASSVQSQKSISVFANGQRILFGQCIKRILQTDVISGEELYVDLKYNSLDSELTISRNQQGTKFEHAPRCPAMLLDSPKETNSVRVGIATVLEYDGKVLITQRHSRLRSFPNGWVVPGGHVEPNETFLETAKRELEEETGLHSIACSSEYLGVWESTYPHKVELGEMTHHHIVVYVHATSKTFQELSIQVSEVQAISWLSRSQVKAIIDGDDMVEIEVYDFELNNTNSEDNNLDSWHSNKGKMSSSTRKLYTGLEIMNKMTMGTRFALRQWLALGNSSKL